VTGVRWVRLDTAFPRNQKVAHLMAMPGGHKAALCYVFALTYAGEQGSDGLIVRGALPFIHARQNDVNKLVEVGLFNPDEGGGGWWINDWAEYQPSSDTMRKRSEAASKAANVRWAEQQRKGTKGNA
jgi:hypothetical protein